MEYEYFCMHIPTGEIFIRKHTFLSREVLLEFIDGWNRHGDKTWKYWTKIV
jgi:hypothetical protein